MLYDLLVPLARDSIVFNVFRYITFRAAMATVTAIVISFVLGPWLIGRLRALQDGGVTIREDTPERHRVKAGTPSMGGFIILAARPSPTNSAAPDAATARPICWCSASAMGPSSSMSPNTTTRRASPAEAPSVSSAARTDTGLAL